MSSPVCVLRWDLSTPADTKERPQRWQRYGFSPVWERTCCFRWLDFLNALLQKLHLKYKEGEKAPNIAVEPALV